MFHGHINTSYGCAWRGTQPAVIHHTRRCAPPFRRALAYHHTLSYHMRERGAHPVKVCEIQVLSTPRQLAAITQSLVGGLRVRKISRLTSSCTARTFSPDDLTLYFSGRDKPICCKVASFETEISHGTVTRVYLFANVGNYFCNQF